MSSASCGVSRVPRNGLVEPRQIMARGMGQRSQQLGFALGDGKGGWDVERRRIE
jgi:hypothetical protein